MVQRPGGEPRARNRSASHADEPGARASNGLSREGALATRQRIRAPPRFAEPASRTSQQGTPDRSAATASRRVAVKSSARGSPQISPITQDKAEHLTPSSIAHSASRASRVSTWMRLGVGSPGGWIRPDSRIAIRSCTQSHGFEVSTWASRNPVQPPSRGCAANSSERVGLGGAGRRILPCICRGGGPLFEWLRGLGKACPTPPPCCGWSPSSRNPGEDFGRAEAAPPVTRERPAATRLTTFLFYFCSYPASPDPESIPRLGLDLLLFEKASNFVDGFTHCPTGHTHTHMRALEFDRLVPLMLEAARRSGRDNAIAP